MPDTEKTDGALVAAAHGSATVELAKPIHNMKDEVTSIRFRKPTGKDILELGNPIDFDPWADSHRVKPALEKIAPMLQRLSGLPTSSLWQLDPNDLMACAWAIAPFFIPMKGTG